MAIRKASRAVLVLVWLIASAVWAHAATPGKITKEHFTYDGRSISYYLFVPKEVTSAASAPLLVLLHGSGRDGSTLVEPWKRLAEKEGIVLVGPDAADRQMWVVPTDGPAALCAMVDEVRKSLPIVNPRRIYLFGHSSGAVFTLFMATLESEYFAAAALHAGAWRHPDDFASLTALARRIPVAMTVGDADPFFPVTAVNGTASELRKAGLPVAVSVIPGHNHNYYAISGKVNEWAWAALKTHALDAEPRYASHQFR